MSFDASILRPGKKQRHSATRPSSPASARPQEPPLKCPRCDSPNTKFCYYNNYNLAQPRYFCKTCRRYWTKGGALRNVPIGGGCRKNKKSKYSSLKLASGREYSKDSNSGSSSSDFRGLKFFQGISTAMDFQLGASNAALPSQFSSLGNLSNSLCAVSSTPPVSFNSGFQEMGSMNFPSNLAASIESLNSINQELYFQLQQQRLAMLFLGESQKENNSSIPILTATESFSHRPQPNLFQNSDNPEKPESCPITASGNLLNERFLDNSYATSSSNMMNENTRNWGGIQSWTELAQFNSLP